MSPKERWWPPEPESGTWSRGWKWKGPERGWVGGWVCGCVCVCWVLLAAEIQALGGQRGKSAQTLGEPARREKESEGLGSLWDAALQRGSFGLA